MLLLESEALTKWCPLARTLKGWGEGVAAANRDFDGTVTDSHKCIASRCMFWRETTRPVSAVNHALGSGLGGPAPRQLPRDAHGHVITRETVGYCGAAPLQARSDVI